MRSNGIVIFYDADFATEIGGAQKRLYYLAKHPKNSDHMVTWVSFKFWSGFKLKYEVGGITYVGILPKPRFYNSEGERSAVEPVLYLLNVILTAPLWVKHRSFLIGQWPLAHIPPILLVGYLLKKNIIVEWWETWGHYWKEQRDSTAGYLLEKLCLKIIDKVKAEIVTDCLEEKKKLEDVVSCCPITVCQNGVDTSYFKKQPKKVNTKRIVSLGRLKSHKRVDVIIDALVMYNDRNKQQPLTLVIIGDGPEREALMHLAKEPLSNGTIEFTGDIESYEELAGELQACDLGVLATQAGGGGNVTLKEYIAAGLPVIAALNGEIGLDETLIQAELNGILVQAPKAELICNALESYYSNIALQKQMLSFVAKQKPQLDWSAVFQTHPLLRC